MKIKYIPNILQESDRIEKNIDVSSGKTIAECIADAGYPIEDQRVIVSGRRVKDLSEIIKESDEVIITPDLRDPVTIGLIISYAILAAKILIAVGTLLSIGYAIYSAFSKPKTPNYGTSSSGADESSPTYGWDGVKTTQNVGTPVPVIYGEHMAGGNIINAFVSSDGDKNYLNMLLAVSEGEIEDIASLAFNDNPATNFTGISTTYKMGTNNQSAIAGFEDLHDEHSIAQSLTKNNPYTYTTVGTAVEAFEVELEFPNGICSVDTSSGGINAWAVSYQIEYKLSTDPTYTDLGITTVSEKSRTTVRRFFRKEGLTAGQYDIRVTRTSDDGDFYNTGDLQLKNIDEIRHQDLIYPNTALIGIKALATDQLSGSTPNVTFIVKGKKVRVPCILNGATEVSWESYYWDPTYNSNTGAYRLLSDGTVLTWDGTTYVDRYSANPIWCMRDLMTNVRYGLGSYINAAEINDTNLLAMARYCDERVPDGDGGYEKRFRLDVVLDGETKALDVIMQLAAAYNGLPFFSAGCINIKIDKEENAVQLFGMGNIIEGSYQETWKTLADVKNVIEIQFMNKDNNYQQETIAYIDEAALAAGDPMRKTSMRAFVTKTSYALRLARYAQKVAKYVKKTFSFKVGIDAIACQPGDVISLSHDVPQYGYSGRILTGSTTTSIKLDRSVTIASGSTYSLMVRLANDTIEEKTVTTGVGTVSTVTVSPAFSSAPAAYDLYVFGVQNAVVQKARIVSIERENTCEAMIQCVEYNANVYDDTAVSLPTTSISALTTGIPDVVNLELTEGSAVNPDGTVDSTIEVWFEKPDSSGYPLENRFREARVYLSDDGGSSYSFIGATSGLSYTIRRALTIGSSYTVKVVSIAESGAEDTLTGAPSDTITIVGKTDVPAGVTGFSYTFPGVLNLSWNRNQEADLAGYEVRLDDIFISGAAPLFKGLATAFSYTPASRTPGAHYIRAYNTSGKYSASSAQVTPANAAPDEIVLSSVTYFNKASVSFSPLADTDIVSYDLYASQTNNWTGEETLAGRVLDSPFSYQGRVATAGVVLSGSSATVLKTDCTGFGDDFFAQDVLSMISGMDVDEERYVSDYDSDTGDITLSSALSVAPAAGDEFFLFERVFVAAKATDPFGSSAFSNVIALVFRNIESDMLGSGVVKGKNLYAANVITLAAQIANAVIQDAHIANCSADKIVSGSIKAAQIILADGGSLESEDYEQGVDGFRLTSDGGLELNKGAVNGDIVLIAGALLRQQFEVTEQNTLQDDDTEWKGSGYSTSNVTVNAADISLDSGQTSGYYISPPIQVTRADLGTIQWEEFIQCYSATNVCTGKTFTAGYSGGYAVSGASSCFDGNSSTTASGWVDGTTKWGQYSYAQVDLGSAKTIRKIRIYHGNYSSDSGSALEYSTDGVTWVTAYACPTGNTWNEKILDSAITARYWRYRSGTFSQGHDGQVCYELELYEDAAGDVTVQTRTAATSDMSGASSWEPSTPLTNPLGSQITSATNEYLQYKIIFTRDSGAAGIVRIVWVQINYDSVLIKNSKKVNGIQASTTATANKLFPLDSNGQLANSVLKFGNSARATGSGKVAGYIYVRIDTTDYSFSYLSNGTGTGELGLSAAATARQSVSAGNVTVSLRDAIGTEHCSLTIACKGGVLLAIGTASVLFNGSGSATAASSSLLVWEVPA